MPGMSDVVVENSASSTVVRPIIRYGTEKRVQCGFGDLANGGDKRVVVSGKLGGG